MSVTGKFLLDRNENFYEHLIALGIPEDRAESVNKLKPVLEILIEGKEVTFTSSSEEFHHKTVLLLDELVDETIAIDYQLKSIVRKIDDHTLEIESTGTTLDRGIRRYEFSDKSLIMIIQNNNRSVPVAKRYYSRISSNL
ncbi:fatty acid-binding protein 1, liver-like [Euwallacea fornicatus]|uniref:fatty acid-binding protein 1, liver-like n=1 Tax=Euwallacea fornicatus TaxID=995702 RepID=UPI00338D3557